MYGAIIGDIVGSAYEFRGIKTKRFLMFSMFSGVTDDSIMTVAVARALMQWDKEQESLQEAMIRNMRELGKKYPDPMGAYGIRFEKWLHSREPEPYRSFGNGSAMRVSPCGLLATSLEEALMLAKISAEVTHNSREGVKGAQAVAAAIYLAKTGSSKEEIRKYISQNFYRLDWTLDARRPGYHFDGTCQGSVPESITAFLESKNYEDAIRNAISMGGDADTMAAIVGSIAWSFYRRRNGGRLTQKMVKLRSRAEHYMPREFLETAEEFAVFCQEEAEKAQQTGKGFTEAYWNRQTQEEVQEEEPLTMPPLILPNRK